MTETTRKHVAIAGGGLAGLATAAYLARAGHHVTLFEQSSGIGGRAATTERDGYLHNMGPHALYPGGNAESVLAELGVGFTGRKPDLAGVAVRGGRTYTLPAGGRSLMTTRLFGVRARIEAGRQLLALQRGFPNDTRTVAEWLAEFSNPVARDYVAALLRVGCYADAPHITPLKDAAAQFALAGRGVTYIDGGWQTLVDGLRDCAWTFGTHIETGARVESVIAGPRPGLRIAGREPFLADAVVLAVPPDTAAKLLPNDTTIARAAAAAIPARAACLDIGLTRLPNPRRRFAVGVDSPFYLSVHTAFARLAPEGRAMLSAAKYLPLGEPHDAARDLAEIEAFVDLVQPGWREFEQHRQYLPNMVVQTALPRSDLGGLAGRPKPTLEGAPGVFIAGDWVGDGGWLADGALGSGRLAARALSEWLASVPAEPALAAAVG